MSEGTRHLFVKEHLLQALASHPEVSDLELEHDFTTVKADLSFRLKNHLRVIEVQRSQVGWTNITQRTSCYHALGIPVLWVLCDDSSLLKGVDTAVPMWQRCLHALSFGVIYYWVEGQIVQPIHLERCPNLRQQFYDVRRRAWRGPSYAYLHTPWFFDHVQITDLHPITRRPGQYGEYVLPAAHLLNLPFETLEQMRSVARPLPMSL